MKLKLCKRCNSTSDAATFHGRVCGDCRAQERKEYYQKNKEKLIVFQKEYYQTNKEEIKNQKKEYYRENKTVISQNHREYEKERLKTDPIFRLRKMASTIVRQSLKKQNTNKNEKSVVKYLPYSVKELKFHLEKQFESWMNWENYSKYDSNTWNDNDSKTWTWTWTLDHIIPQSDLPYSSMEDDNFKRCWALENLRPLSAKQNLLDGSLRIRHGSKQ